VLFVSGDDNDNVGDDEMHDSNDYYCSLISFIVLHSRPFFTFFL
jgi:hypothetical protein